MPRPTSRWLLIGRHFPGVGVEPVGQGVAQEHDVAELTHLAQVGAAVAVPRQPAVGDDPVGAGLGDEERGDDDVQLVGERPGEELGVHLLASFDEQQPHALLGEVGEDPGHRRRSAGGHDAGDAGEPGARVVGDGGGQ